MSAAGKTLFITGATGFIGKVFLARLLPSLSAGDTVYLLVRTPIGFRDPRVVCLRGELNELGSYKRQLLASNYVFHLAANAVFGSGADYDGVNFAPTAAMADMLKESTVLERLVFLSTIGAIDRQGSDNCSRPLTVESVPNPTSGYGRSKIKAEDYIRASGVSHTIIRPTWVYGRDMRQNSHINAFVTMVCRGTPIARLDFPGRVSLIHVDDLATAMVNCMGNDKARNRTYIAETEDASIGEMFGLIHRKLRGEGLGRLKVPSFGFVVGALHRWMPLTVSNLFIDYLFASDERFRADLLPGGFRRISDGIDDVIATNACASGHWVITGANGGIGFALAERLAAEGRKMVLVDLDTGNLGKYESGHMVIKADLTVEADIKAVVRSMEGLKIFCLINNAGVGYRRSLAEVSEEEIRTSIDLNVRAPVLLTKLLYGSLVRDGSVIVNIASSVAYNPLPNMAMYSATKAFLANWSESVTYEMKATNRVITVSPAGTNTGFQKAGGVKVLREGKGLMKPGYVADQILRKIRGRGNVLLIGAPTKLLLFICRFLPRQVNIKLWGMMFEKLR